MDKLYHKGVMRTKCDDCQFVCVTQTDYYRILHQGEESQRRHEEDGRVVMVTENRANETDPNRRGHLVIKGTQQRYIILYHQIDDYSIVLIELLAHLSVLMKNFHIFQLDNLFY